MLFFVLYRLLGSLCLLAELLFCSFSEGTFREQGVLHCSVDSCFAQTHTVEWSFRAAGGSGRFQQSYILLDYMDFLVLSKASDFFLLLVFCFMGQRIE